MCRDTENVDGTDHMANDGSVALRDGGNADGDHAWDNVSDLEMDIDSNEILECIREELEAIPEGDPAQVELLDSLGYMVFEQYSGSKAMSHLDEAIQIARQVVNLTPEGDPERRNRLNNIGIRLGERYSRNGELSDFKEAAEAMRSALNLPTSKNSDDLHPAELLHNLGCLLGATYSRTGRRVHIDEAIRVTRQAVDQTPNDHPGWVARANNLGLRLSDRYNEEGIESDLDEAIEIAKRALNAAPVDHPDYPGLLTNLGARLGDRYSRRNVPADLDEAVRYMRQAVYVLSADHPSYAMLLSNLGNQLGQQYLRSGDKADLKEAVETLRLAAHKTPNDDPGRAAHFNNYGLQLGEEYLREGSIDSLDKGIKWLQRAVDATTDDDPHRAISMNNLAALLSDRHLRKGAMTDLEEALQILRKSIEVTPETHPTSIALSTNLGMHLGSRYTRSKTASDLDEAIRVIRKVLESTPEDHPNRIVQLDILAILLGQQHLRTGSMTHLKEAIEVASQAVKATPQDHHYRAKVLNNLGDELHNLYLITKDPQDLEKAISYLLEALKIMPHDHPERSALLGNLGEHLDSRYATAGRIEDRQEAIAHYQSALNQANSYTLSRIWAGRRLLHNVSDWQQAYAAARVVVDLVPKLSSRSLRNSDKQHALGQVMGVASDAAAVALQAGQPPLAALRLLEQGRGVLGASLQDSHIDILTLREKDSALADEFVRLQEELEAEPRQPMPMEGSNPEATQRALTSRRYEASQEFDELIIKIQQVPGFRDFLLPPSETDIKFAAQHGPIVVINVSKHRCDAFLVESHRVRALALDQLSMKDVEDKSCESDLGSHDVLEWLWDTVARPILGALGFTDTPNSEDSWPHVWWIPTGPLSKFPIHAAGYHIVRSSETTLDRVMSSYASSIRAIIYGRGRGLLPATSDQVLLVAMEHTPGNHTLPFATKEVRMVWNLCESMTLQPIEPKRCKQEVESHLRSCKIFHFAGHGTTNAYNASESGLILEDGILRVAELLEMKLSQRSQFFAYLSACGTGRIKDEKSIDESIHLMSAFQLAGFRHVVGTLWDVRDEICMDMARITYEGIIHGATTDQSVCRGLHQASRSLRDKCLSELSEAEDGCSPPRSISKGNVSDGQEKGLLYRDADAFDAGLAPWTPYVHFGV